MAGLLPSLGSRLDGAYAKVGRADQHVSALKQSLKRFSHRDPYAIGAEQSNSQVVVQPARVHVTRTINFDPTGALPPLVTENTRMLATTYVASITMTPKAAIVAPSLRWATMIGDVVHNLASALDNLVWELAQASKDVWPAEPPPAASSRDRRAFQQHWNRLGFPYTKERSQWRENTERYLVFVNPVFHTILEQAQPFHAWENRGQDAEHHPFWILHELWNRDKHRALNLGLAAIGCQGVQIIHPHDPPDAPQPRAELIQTFPLRPIERKTQVALVRVHVGREFEVPSQMQMQVKGEFTLGILLGDGTIAAGDNALDKLLAARNAVVELLNKCH